VHSKFAKGKNDFFSYKVTSKEWGVPEINTHPSRRPFIIKTPSTQSYFYFILFFIVIPCGYPLDINRL